MGVGIGNTKPQQPVPGPTQIDEGRELAPVADRLGDRSVVLKPDGDVVGEGRHQ
jgi:hypothetical protein